MPVDFKGLKLGDFNSISGTNWRKTLAKAIINRFKYIGREEMAIRIPYHKKTIYFGEQPFFEENLMKYAYGALFISLEKDLNNNDVMWIGYKVERGYEKEGYLKEIKTEDTREHLLMASNKKYWDWYRFEENVKNEEFVDCLKDLGMEYRFAAFRDGNWRDNIYTSKSLDLFNFDMLNWQKELNDKWADILVYKELNKDEVLRMKPDMLLDEIIQVFEKVIYIYDKTRYLKG